MFVFLGGEWGKPLPPKKAKAKGYPLGTAGYFNVSLNLLCLLSMELLRNPHPSQASSTQCRTHNFVQPRQHLLVGAASTLPRPGEQDVEDMLNPHNSSHALT